MNYELCKKLKDAGFPQNKPSKRCDRDVRSWFIDDSKFCEDGGYMTRGGIKRAYVPTLSELIEACGEEFMLTNEGGVWEAWQGAESNVVRMGEAGAKHRCEGSSPEEAVANLWLAIKSA